MAMNIPGIKNEEVKIHTTAEFPHFLLHTCVFIRHIHKRLKMPLHLKMT